MGAVATTPVHVLDYGRIPIFRVGLKLGVAATFEIAPAACVRLIGADPRRATMTIACLPTTGTVCFGRTQAEAMEEATAWIRPVVLDPIAVRMTHTGQLWAANHGVGIEVVSFFTEYWAD